ncbi:MAG: hypothetical protein B7C24_00305 [Bacteroidetes bacterium 4572_77]|nr:MAG: hypothetical protein B7C24_00305 [Bacteroidetes bacterium 4572_77]
MFSRKFIIRAIAFMGIYVAAASYIFTNEEKFFFSHNKIEATEIFSFQETFQELQIPLNKETQLHGLLFPQENAKGLVLLFPSGDYNALDFKVEDLYLYQQSYSILIPSYRSSGKSTGVYLEEKDLYNDAQQWFKMAKSIADSSSLIIYGQGFGDGMAAWVAGSNEVDLLILEEPYYTWKEQMLNKYFWWLPHTWFSQYEIPLWQFLRKSTSPILIFSAIDSDFVKKERSLQLLEFLKPGDKYIDMEGESIDQEALNYQKEVEESLK